MSRTLMFNRVYSSRPKFDIIENWIIEKMPRVKAKQQIRKTIRVYQTSYAALREKSNFPDLCCDSIQKIPMYFPMRRPDQ
jgi:hypothetical protein